MADEHWSGHPILYLPALVARQIAQEEPLPLGA